MGNKTASGDPSRLEGLHVTLPRKRIGPGGVPGSGPSTRCPQWPRACPIGRVQGGGLAFNARMSPCSPLHLQPGGSCPHCIRTRPVKPPHHAPVGVDFRTVPFRPWADEVAVHLEGCGVFECPPSRLPACRGAWTVYSLPPGLPDHQPGAEWSDGPRCWVLQHRQQRAALRS